MQIKTRTLALAVLFLSSASEASAESWVLTDWAPDRTEWALDVRVGAAASSGESHFNAPPDGDDQDWSASWLARAADEAPSIRAVCRVRHEVIGAWTLFMADGSVIETAAFGESPCNQAPRWMVPADRRSTR
ncbi:MAG: hypothetical protein KC620_10870 [Myxococcales bacterium]|nr:hypothetical protein [Myxococcales bacterium]